MNTAGSSLPGSEHFRLERLTDGVYVAIASDTGAATCNAGIVDLGDRTLIFDTFLTPRAAKDLRAAAAQLTGREDDEPSKCCFVDRPGSHSFP